MYIATCILLSRRFLGGMGSTLSLRENTTSSPSWSEYGKSLPGILPDRASRLLCSIIQHIQNRISCTGPFYFVHFYLYLALAYNYTATFPIVLSIIPEPPSERWDRCRWSRRWSRFWPAAPSWCRYCCPGYRCWPNNQQRHPGKIRARRNELKGSITYGRGKGCSSFKIHFWKWRYLLLPLFGKFFYYIYTQPLW